MLNTPSKDKWRRIGTDRRAGILVPLFSVYSQNSIGIGDLEDLKLLIDWARKTGNSIVQLLPLNEMGELFCPYDSLSSFALEPIYISLRGLPQLKKKKLKEKMEHIKKTFAFPRLHIDYSIKEKKIGLLWEIYLAEEKQCLKEIAKFKQENAYWLSDFCLFKVLKAQHSGAPWYEWEDKYKNRAKNELEVFKQLHEREINFQIWLQWLAFKQFKEVKLYAKAKKVLLKGDLPILVSRDSADVWTHPEFFKLEFAAGAPPDMYCALGQRWGMPTYNWERIEADNYRYLKEKLKFAENFYDILRIDHVVGLFRIWSIPYNEPLENKGLNGSFDPAEEKKWEAHGRKILSVILNSTRMLILAEDLGIIPKACPKALEEFGIPGNDVQRWVKDWKVKHDFLNPQDYRLLSVAMLSTHDTTNWPAWWENEAGTVDAELFRRRCAERNIDYNYVKDKLFDFTLSQHGRLRWLNSINSISTLVTILDKKKEALTDFIDFYENTYQEKEKLWRHLNLNGPMREKCDRSIIRASLKLTLESRSIFCIQSLIDWLFLTDVWKADPYEYRINTPATVSKNNWSLVIPLSLEELLKHKVCQEMREMIKASERMVLSQNE